MSINLERLAEALCIYPTITDEDRQRMKQRREEGCDTIVAREEVIADKIYNRIEELVMTIESLKYIRTSIPYTPPPTPNQNTYYYIDNTTADAKVYTSLDTSVTKEYKDSISNKNEEDDYKYGNGVMDMLQ